MNPDTKSKPCPYCTGDPVDFADDAGYEMTIFWKGVGEPVIRCNEYPYSVLMYNFQSRRIFYCPICGRKLTRED